MRLWKMREVLLGCWVCRGQWAKVRGWLLERGSARPGDSSERVWTTPRIWCHTYCTRRHIDDTTYQPCASAGNNSQEVQSNCTLLSEKEVFSTSDFPFLFCSVLALQNIDWAQSKLECKCRRPMGLASKISTFTACRSMASASAFWPE